MHCINGINIRRESFLCPQLVKASSDLILSYRQVTEDNMEVRQSSSTLFTPAYAQANINSLPTPKSGNTRPIYHLRIKQLTEGRQLRNMPTVKEFQAQTHQHLHLRGNRLRQIDYWLGAYHDCVAHHQSKQLIIITLTEILNITNDWLYDNGKRAITYSDDPKRVDAVIKLRNTVKTCFAELSPEQAVSTPKTPTCKYKA